jgi:hypothetical protein
MVVVQVKLALDDGVNVVECGATVEVEDSTNLGRALRSDGKTKNTMRHGCAKPNYGDGRVTIRGLRDLADVDALERPSTPRALTRIRRWNTPVRTSVRPTRVRSVTRLK